MIIINKNPFVELTQIIERDPPGKILSMGFFLGSVSNIEPLAIIINEMSLRETDIFRLNHIGALSTGDIVIMSPYYDNQNSLTPNKYILWGVIE